MIFIYRTKTCPYCRMVSQLCERYKVTYKYIELDDDPQLRRDLQEKTGHTTAPITSDGHTYIAGWQPAKLMKLIKEQ